MSALEVKENECVKIMTGAMVPKGIETIIPIECMLESHTNFALAPKDFKINANIRQKGENASLNSVLVPKKYPFELWAYCAHRLSRVKRNQGV